MNHEYYVYILTNKSGALYTGVTNDLIRRTHEHKNKLIPGFTARYNLDRLVYYEACSDIRDAIAREKLDWKYITNQLQPLIDLKEAPHIMKRLKKLRKDCK